MEKLLTSDNIQLFILAVFPGLISMHIYRLFLPAKAIDWKTAIVEGMFYSAVNFALCFPILALVSQDAFPTTHPIWFGLAILFSLLVGPVLWPIFLTKLLKSKKLMSKLQHPYPTSWDAFFDRRQECFMIIHLANGKKIGAYYGATSYASAFPNEGDLYVRAVYLLKNDNTFGDAMPDTRGLLIRKAEYSYIELFDVPKQNQE